jgi:pyridoxine 4-dehydrogenase
MLTWHVSVSRSKIVPIAAVEVELSMFETRVLTNGVATACAELNIPLIPYSPLGRGILTGKWTAMGDIPKDSPLNRLDKYQGDNLAQNLKLVHELQSLSRKYAPHTMAQLAMSWLRQLSAADGMPVMIPIAGSSKAENVRSNGVHVNLKQEDMAAIKKILEANQTIGDRAYTGQKQYLEG